MAIFYAFYARNSGNAVTESDPYLWVSGGSIESKRQNMQRPGHDLSCLTAKQYTNEHTENDLSITK